MMRVFLVGLALFAPNLVWAELQTVPYVDLDKYAGNWYEISHVPLPFDGGDCACVRQRISLGFKPGVLAVFNSCNIGNAQGALMTGSSQAWDEDKSTNARFTLDIYQGFVGTYWIIGLDPAYRYAVVSDKDQFSLRIFSKTPTLAPELYQKALALAAKQLDTSKLMMTDQEGCQYPQ